MYCSNSDGQGRAKEYPMQAGSAPLGRQRNKGKRQEIVRRTSRPCSHQGNSQPRCNVARAHTHVILGSQAHHGPWLFRGARLMGQRRIRRKEKKPRRRDGTKWRELERLLALPCFRSTPIPSLSLVAGHEGERARVRPSFSFLFPFFSAGVGFPSADDTNPPLPAVSYGKLMS